MVLATSAPDLHVTGRNMITIVCDKTNDQVSGEDFDLLVLPGGGSGVEALQKSSFALDLIRSYFEQKKWVGAICAAPLVLKKAGVLHGQSITSYPSAQVELKGLTNYRQERVVIDDFLITSRGPGTAVEFGLALIEKLFGPKKSFEIKTQVVG